MKKVIAEKISAIINPNAEAPQLSARTIDEVLEILLARKDESQTEDDFIEEYLPFFQTMAGNVRKDVSDFSKKLEDKKKEAAKQEPEKEPEKEDEDTPEWAKGLLSKFNELEEWKAKQESATTVEKMREKALSDARKLYPEKVVEAALLNFDFNKEEAEKEFQSTLSKVAGLWGIVPERGGSEDKVDFSDFFKEEAKRRGITD